MFISGLVLWQTEGQSALIGLWVCGLLVFIPGFHFTRIAYLLTPRSGSYAAPASVHQRGSSSSGSDSEEEDGAFGRQPGMRSPEQGGTPKDTTWGTFRSGTVRGDWGSLSNGVAQPAAVVLLALPSPMGAAGSAPAGRCCLAWLGSGGAGLGGWGSRSAGGADDGGSGCGRRLVLSWGGHLELLEFDHSWHLQERRQLLPGLPGPICGLAGAAAGKLLAATERPVGQFLGSASEPNEQPQPGVLQRYLTAKEAGADSGHVSLLWVGSGDGCGSPDAAVASPREHTVPLSCAGDLLQVYEGGALPELRLSAETLPPSCRELGLEVWTAFLRSLYSASSDFQWETIGGVLALADYFGAGGVLSRADAWLCRQCRGGAAEPTRSCAAFELAARHRLGGAMALLLPFAVQCMARGSRCASIWFDGKQRCCRLKAAFNDPQLKCLVLDAYWWSREAQEACTEPSCHCRPVDIYAEWDTRQEWAAAPARSGSNSSAVAGCTLHPQAYARAEAEWACTPVAAATELLPPAAA
ncbi:ATP-dependent DNA helicase isoform A [Chlorella sorokiniana]|uniref:ATP-dependent DNA helicase isoform A n=1 Tax=Chlorella sorokiniana TaxID=3076 RepID=A0A2P6U2T3_CHLSO|nr:ATP-dependent DNA helicase isoform A [Chlorella sorokiniana]|eukprot:PRW60621.1 ATP-dependent DNA helicase isoform A [Chlorella sorokiniana]